METYRLSSKLAEKDNEYLIQTVNDTNLGTVSTSIYINGVLTETVNSLYPVDISGNEVLSLVKITHEETKKEIENLLQSYRKVIETGDAKMAYYLGTAFFYKGFYQEARNLFTNATELDASHHQAFNYLGLTELARGNIHQAIVSSRRAVALKPAFADYRNNLGEALLADDAVDEAVAEFEKAIEINLYYCDAYLNLGLALILKTIKAPDRTTWPERLARINDYFYKASLINPVFKSQAFDEGLKTLKQFELSRALNIFKRIRDTKKENYRREFSGFYMKFALLTDWVSEEVLQERILYLKKELEKNPGYVDLHAELARCYLEQARLVWQRGVEGYRKSNEINPALSKIKMALDIVENISEDISLGLRKIAEKG
ncbi:MAG: tetratricopeptide repeat protein [candidate division Zixibacteria bacterium]|nr:tetratricopeptide repeat protein [candidate division Zixibacteria bacterium]MDD5426497.1 tetratricopeptide repeat protein [candidate division Zixibacteria bacterium]